MIRQCTIGIGCVLLALTTTALCQEEPPQRRIMAEAAYVREESDRAWNLQIAGNIPTSMPLYVVIHDAQSRLIYHGAIQGKYPLDKPYLIPIKQDGITGDYRIVLIGGQVSMLALQWPLTDLPLEVNGGRGFSMGHSASRIFFRAPDGASQIAIAAYRGNLQVLTAEGKVIADTKVSGKYITTADDPNAKYFSRNQNIVECPAKPGEIYQVNAAETMYFQTREEFYFAFDANRLFEPKEELKKVKWWNLIP